jgi:hypothetical protein
MAVVITLPHSVSNPHLRNISELPFQKTNLALWVNANGAPPLPSNPDRAGSLVDRNNAEVYSPTTSGASRLLLLHTVNNLPVLRSLFASTGSPSAASGYSAPNTIWGNEAEIFCTVRRFVTAGSNAIHNLVFGAGGLLTDATTYDNSAIVRLRYYETNLQLAVRQSNGASATLLSVPITDGLLWDTVHARINWIAGTCSLTVNGLTVTGSLSTTTAPVFPSGTSTLIGGLASPPISNRQFRGDLANLLVTGTLTARQRTEMQAYSAGWQTALNAA